jgi:hypothetical protein
MKIIIIISLFLSACGFTLAEQSNGTVYRCIITNDSNRPKYGLDSCGKSTENAIAKIFYEATPPVDGKATVMCIIKLPYTECDTNMFEVK